jgi:indolepyruvate ferredoxin oxidoreductase
LDEAPATPRRSPLTEAVARNFFKLLAYKDEYEVARLYADPEFKKKLAAAFDGKPKLKLLLAPPFLSRLDPATGRPRKMPFGGWIIPAFALLARLKFLRGTAFDPFGWTKERRGERRLVEAYERMIATLLPALSRSNIDAAVAIAKLPQAIRGFGPLKSASIEACRQSERKLLAEFYNKGAMPDRGAGLQMIAAE